MKTLFSGVIGVAALLCAAGAASAGPIIWTLNNVAFSDGGTATGTFTFDADSPTACSGGTTPCGTFSSVNITTTAGSVLGGTNYSFVCGTGVASCTGISPDSTEVLFLTSNAANQTGLLALAVFFTAAGPVPPAGLTDAGGVIDISNGLVGAVQEASCLDAACSAPVLTNARSTVAGTVSAGVPEPMSAALFAAGLGALIFAKRRRALRP